MGPDLWHRVRSGARVNCLNLLPLGVLTTHTTKTTLLDQTMLAPS